MSTSWEWSSPVSSTKGEKDVAGENQALDILRKQVDPNAKYIWVHAASLGEFEQGRPLMERIRKEHPEYKILLTFFSPSGYEVRKTIREPTSFAISRLTRSATHGAFCAW